MQPHGWKRGPGPFPGPGGKRRRFDVMPGQHHEPWNGYHNMNQFDHFDRFPEENGVTGQEQPFLMPFPEPPPGNPFDNAWIRPNNLPPPPPSSARDMWAPENLGLGPPLAGRVQDPAFSGSPAPAPQPHFTAAPTHLPPNSGDDFMKNRHARGSFRTPAVDLSVPHQQTSFGPAPSPLGPPQSSVQPSPPLPTTAVRKKVDPRARHAFYVKGPESGTSNLASGIARKEERLHLVLDLDNTLIHATSDPRAKAMMEGAFEDLSTFLLTPPPHTRTAPFQVFVKMRPGLKEFLLHASQLFDLHIYTMGTREYADGIARILDPEAKLFNGRIVSREDAAKEGDAPAGSGKPVPMKSLAKIFDDDSNVLVLDDREDVWSKDGQSCRNLVKIEPFVFFPGLKGMNELPGNGSSNPVDAFSSASIYQANSRTALAADDDHLSCVLAILRAVHRAYNNIASSTGVSPPDVKDLLVSVKQRVLSGVRLVLLGLSSNDELVSKAQAFGAQCFRADEVDADGKVDGHRITHVIVTRGGMAKASQDLKCSLDDIQVVHYRWLVDSMKHWRRPDEQKYEITEEARTTSPPQ